MITKISVSVERSHPARFSALLDELNKAKALADATEAETMPIINEAGEAKYKAIIAQLQELQEMFTRLPCRSANAILVQLPNVNDYKMQLVINDFGVHIHKIGQGYYMGTDYDIYNANKGTAKKYSYFSDTPYYVGSDGIFTNWNSLGIADKAMVQLENCVQSSIEQCNAKTARINQTLSNLLND